MIRYIKTNSFYKLYLNVITSIAFVPTLIAIALFLVSLLTLYMDQASPDRILGYKMSIKNLINPDSARSLLSSIAGGMISLMVFSFSMVMVVLNQTASNYTPRVLPSLVGKRFHQVVMGFYLGTIAYTFVVLSSIQSKIYAFAIPSLSIIINALLSIICLALFVAFIQSISQSIQIGNIVHTIYTDTRHGLEHENKKKVYVPLHELPDSRQWFVVKSPVAGYFNEIEYRAFLRKTKDMDITIRMLVFLGKFANLGDPFFAVSRSLSQEEQDELFQTMVFRHQEMIRYNYLYGFKQLTEIATKALSPGINDPGTAIQALDRLTDLFIRRMSLQGTYILKDDDQKLRMIAESVPIEEIFYFSFSTIRNYTGNDIPVIHKLFLLIRAMARNDTEHTLTETLLIALNDALEQFIPEIRSLSDKQRLVQLAEEIIAIDPGHQQCAKAREKLNGLLQT